ncbi:MAG: DUF2085 domain-containing protein [Ardenticatenia bacterium]|nr:DUF2085 domain-containing protein [Ardenticatenia bacterium]
MSEGVYATGRTRDLVMAIDRIILKVTRHWLLVVYASLGLYIGLAALAPLLMAANVGGLGQAIYRFYSFQCHQLPQRSYYLFGQMGAIQTYSLDQVLAQGGDPNNLRAFIGNPEMGFKLAIAQRLTAIYTALFLGGLLWGLFGRRLPRLGMLGYLLFVLPMALDGGSHMVSEVTRLGFRESNAWAEWLTGGLAAAPFYVGTTIGTLNWLLRTLTGTLLGLGTAWFIFPYLAEGFGDIRRQLEIRLR